MNTREVVVSLIPISEIKVNPGRREVSPEQIKGLADSISEIGLINPITVDREYTLIAGLNRLEAFKLLGIDKIECTVSGLSGLQAELAEIDENMVRGNLSTIDLGDLLLKRKKVYEALYPETKYGVSQALGMNRSVGNNVAAKLATTSKSFVDDTADKLGVGRRTVRRQLQIAKNLDEEAKNIVRETGSKITQYEAEKLSRMEPEQQIEAVSLLASGDIDSIDDYPTAKSDPEIRTVPFGPIGKTFASFSESIADLKSDSKDCSCTPDSFLAEITSFSRSFCKDIQCYTTPYYEAVFPRLSSEQLKYVRQQMDNICDAAQFLYKSVKGKMK